MSFSSYTNEQGETWHIPDLLESTYPRTKRLESVSKLLLPLLSEERWGESVGTIREVLQLVPNLPSQMPDAGFEQQSAQHHAAVVLSLMDAIRNGWEPEAIVIGLDGRIWDGLHRLAALYLSGAQWVSVIDFSATQQQSDLNQRTKEYLVGHLNPELLTSPALTDLQHGFWSAKGYRHSLITDFLSPSFAQECYSEILGLDWKRHETDFFSQDEFILESTDRSLPTALGRLSALLYSKELQVYLTHITGNRLIESPEVVIHRMRPGDYVGIHNDFRPHGERFRCVLYLGQMNAGLDHGAFIAFADGSGSKILDVFAPSHNSMIMFDISPLSFHMVTEIQDEARYSIILSYYELTGSTTRR